MDCQYLEGGAIMGKSKKRRIRTVAKKFYAIRKGKQTGIFNSWDECKALVSGISGAEYKSFLTAKEAMDYINGASGKVILADLEKTSNSLNKEGTDFITAYVDGSYNNDTKEFSYGMVILYKGEELYFSQKVEDDSLVSMRNVAGEIKGAEAAMNYALKEGCPAIKIYYDYEGIEKWCTGAWSANKEGTKAYKAFYDSIRDKLLVEFVKVKGHSNDKYNDIADELAKKAIF